MADLIDTALIKQAQAGNTDAIAQLYDRYHQRIFRYVWIHVHSLHLAEDLTGEVFTRMMSKLVTYRPTGVPFQAWLYRIAHNLIVDHYRKENRMTLVQLDRANHIRDEEDNPVAQVEQQLSVERVKLVLEELDPAQRDVVVLRFLMGLSLKEAAHTLGKTVASVKSLQHRGLKTLRAVLLAE